MARLQVAAGIVIVFVWALAFIDGSVTQDYHGFDVSTPVMVVFASFLFGDKFLRKRYDNE